jgi:hypothetical protein
MIFKRLLILYLNMMIFFPFVLFLIKVQMNLFSKNTTQFIYSASPVITFLLVIALFKLFRKLGLLVGQDSFVNRNKIFYIFLVILFWGINGYLFYRVFTPLELTQLSGDGINHLRVVRDVISIPQEINSHIYLENGFIRKGIFYPILSHYFPALLSVLFDFSIVNSYFLATTVMVFAVLPIYTYLLIDKLSNSLISFYVTLSSSLIFIYPFNFIETQLFSSMVASIFALLFIYLVLNLKSHKLISFCVVFITFVLILYYAHPSSVFIFVIVLTMLKFKTSKIIIYKYKWIFLFLTAASLILVNQIINSYIFKVYLNSFPKENQTYFNSYVEFLPTIIQNINKNFLFLSDQKVVFPFLALLLILFGVFKKQIFPISNLLLRCLLLYLTSSLILVMASFAGLDGFLRFTSYLGIFFYNTPSRITPLIYISFLILLSVLLHHLYNLYSSSKMVIFFNSFKVQLLFILILNYAYYVNMFYLQNN